MSFCLFSSATARSLPYFEDNTLADADPAKITFSKEDFEQNIDAYFALLGDRMDCIQAAKAVYDWSVVSGILQDHTSISAAKIQSYEQHRQDLALLKSVIQKQGNKDDYKNMFRDDGLAANYCAYIGKSKAKPNKSVCSKEDFYKYVSALLKDMEGDDVDYIRRQIENDTFLPRQTTAENGVIPYQLHLKELNAILAKAERHFPFLKAKDARGLTVFEKIVAIMKFRIPYYIGPLNDAHAADEKHGHSWIVKKESGPIRPWNFSEKVDMDASAEKFIRRMTNKCTYLLGADVIPQNSLLYSKYMMLNEINNLRVNGTKLDVETKQALFETVCQTKNKIRRKDIQNYLVSIGKMEKDDELTGVDVDLTASMKSYLDFKKILGNSERSEWNEEIIEECIKTLVLFPEEEKMVRNRIAKICRGRYSEAQIRAISKLKYSGWSRLSKELLTEIKAVDKSSGEIVSIIAALYQTNENLMQLLSGEWGFMKQIGEYNARIGGAITKFSYEDIVEPLYCSPAVKRGIWRALVVVAEIEKITGRPPKQIFVEMAREEGEKKRTVSRKNALLELYKKCGEDGKEWQEALLKRSDGDLRRTSLYLYYTQMGRCMYSGERIELSDLYNDNLYDIDHIYPRSKTKDDSVDNKVLVKKTLNNRVKSDRYPLPAVLRTHETVSLWKRLLKMGLIGKVKYDRLMRTEEFSPDELAGFISRQLVETRQSTKAIAEALQKLYQAEKTEIVFVKAGNISDFRHKFGFTKVRDVNDLHHAKDAYLSIVVGNVYNTKFTKNPANYIKNVSARNYSLNHLFEEDVERHGRVAWKMGGGGTIATVRSTVASNRILFTRYAVEETGGFYNQKPMNKGRGQIPLKTSDARLSNIDRYGGYNADRCAYFILVEHLKKKKTVRSLEYVPVRLAAKIAADPDALARYCVSPSPAGLGLVNPRVLLAKIKINTLFFIDGFPMHISSRTNDYVSFKVGAQLCLDDGSEAYIKKIGKFLERRRQSAREPLYLTAYDEISAEQNLKLYDLLLAKHRDTVYAQRPGSQMATLAKGREKFMALPPEEQCEAISHILGLFKCVFREADLRLIGGSGRAGTVKRNKEISKCDRAVIVHQSPTGLFSNVIDLLAL